MTLVPVWLHVLGVVVWVGGLAWQAHVLGPLARRGEARLFAEAAARARPMTWTAVAVVVLTGLYNVTQLGSLAQVMESGAGLALSGKFILVLVAVAVAAQRDFTHVPRLRRAVAGDVDLGSSGRPASPPDDPASVLRAIAWLDRLVLLLAVVIVYLGLFVSRGRG